jgi:hypothetical protein
MKKIISVIFSIIILFNLSCKSDKCCVLPQPSSHMAADKNGTAWNSFNVIGKLTVVDSLNIYAISGEENAGAYIKADSLNIKILYSDKGTYPLHGNQVFYATFTNGVTKSYKLDTTYNNVFSIIGYETLHNPATTNPDEIKLTGTFDLKFIDPNNPSGISFSNGSFYTIMSQ